MATERTTDIVLRAQVDKALQPLDQVLQRVKQLTTVLDQQRDAASKGDTTLAEYSKALRDVENAAKDLLRARVALNTYQDKQATLDAKQQAVAEKRQARDTFQATLPADPTKAQERQLASLEKALQRSEAQANTASRAFEKAAAEMERMQIAVDKLDETHAQITIFRDMASDALAAGNAVNDTLIATLKVARAEKEANEKRIADREKLLQAIAKTNAGLRAEAEAVEATAAKDAEAKQRMLARVNVGLGDLGTKQQAADALEAAKLQEAADKKRNADAEAAQNKARTIAQANVGIARLEAQEREKALQVETTLQQAADRARVDAAQAAENKARTLAQANVGFARLEAAEREKALAAEAALQKAADDQRVKDAQAAAKELAKAEKERADLVQAVRNAETAAMREDYKDAQAAEEALAKQRKKDADDFQASQARLREAVAAVWQEEAKEAENARLAVAAFEATAAAALARVREVMAHGTAQAGAVGAPVGVAATPLATQVRTALGTAPGAGTTGGTLAGLQSEIAAITASVTAGTGAIKNYSDELKRLDTVARETVRQSQIIDSFQKQKEAAQAALTAFHDLAEQIKALEAQAAAATTPEEVAEVTSKITAARRRLGSVEEGTGLAAAARKEVEALTQEEAALNAIGVTAGRVEAAMRELTNVAVSTSAERQTILDKERIANQAAADEAIRRAAVGPTAAAITPTVRSAVSAVGAAERGAPIEDTAAAVNKLDASVGKGKLTLQTYNKVMDETYAIQRQIVSDASLIDNFTKQAAATDKARIAFTDAQAEVVRLANAVKAGTATLAELTQAEQKLDAARSSLQREVTQQTQLDAVLKARRIDTANLVVETDKLTASATRLAAVQQRAQGGQTKFFGLSPYQLQNLSFQINDVVTQLSLGQGVLRTLEAQGGQIFQVFETSVTAIKQILLIGAPVAAVLGTMALAMERVFAAEASLRQFNAALAGTVDASQRSASALLGLQRTAERMGVSFEEAGTAVKTFLGENLSTERIEQFTAAAINMSKAFGITVDEATKRLIIIPKGSIDDLEKLLFDMKLLTPELVKYFETQRQGGSIDDARATTIREISEAMKLAAKEGAGPFEESITKVKNAWKDLLDQMGSSDASSILKTVWKGLLDDTDNLLNNFRKLIALNQAVGSSIKNDGLLAAYKTLFYGVPAGGNSALKNTQQEVTSLDAQLKKAKETYDDFKTHMGADQDNPLLDGMLKKVDELTKKLVDAKTKLNLLQITEGSPEGGPIPDVMAPQRATAAQAALAHQGETLQTVAPFLGQNIGPIVNAWCAAFANAALKAAGIQGSGSNVATSFENWGTAVANAAEVRAGDVLVQARGNAAGETGGHVGIATGQTKVGPNGGLLVEMVSGNLGGRVATSFESAAGLDIRRAGIQLPPTGGTTSPMTGTQSPGLAAAKNEEERIKLQRKIDEQLAQEAMGNSAARIKNDEEIAKAKERELQKEADHDRDGMEESTANVNRRAKFMADFRAHQKSVRDKEDAEVKQEADAAARALQDRIANADPTNAAAKRQAAINASQASLDQIDTLVKKGVETIGGMPINAFRDQVLKLRDEAVAIATVEADKAIVDAAVKERDERVAAIAAELHAGTITLDQAFQQTADVVKKSGERIKAAIAASNADLAGQPPTARVQERQAANAKVDPNDVKAFDALQQQGLTKINDLVAARNKQEQTYTQLVANGRMTQSEADERINKLYADSKKGIDDAVKSQRDMIESLHDTGKISDETYQKMIANLDAVTSSTDNLTAHQRKLLNEFSGVIVNAADQGINTIAESLGKVVAGTEKWGDALKDAGVAFGQFVASVLKGIAEIILKEELEAAIKSSGGLTGILGKLFGAGAGAAGAAGAAGGGAADIAWDLPLAAAHAGGIAGAFNMSRSGISPLVFLNAPRMHNGGLASDEVATVLRKGEEVLPADDPRHRYNLSGKSSEVTSMPNIRQVLVMDPAQTSAALAGSHGEKVVITHIKNNAGAIRGILNQR